MMKVELFLILYQWIYMPHSAQKILLHGFSVHDKYFIHKC